MAVDARFDRRRTSQAAGAMDAQYWKERREEALRKAGEAVSARTCLAYLELAQYYQMMEDFVRARERETDTV